MALSKFEIEVFEETFRKGLCCKTCAEEIARALSRARDNEASKQVNAHFQDRLKLIELE